MKRWAHWEKFCGLFLRKLFCRPIERSNKSKTFDLCGRVIAWESNCVTLRNFSWLKSLSRYYMCRRFTYSTGITYFSFVCISIPASCSDIWKYECYSCKYFHRRQKLLLAGRGGGKLIPDLEFREGPQILRPHQLLSYLNAYWARCATVSLSAKDILKVWNCPGLSAKRAKIAQPISRKWKLAGRGILFEGYFLGQMK